VEITQKLKLMMVSTIFSCKSSMKSTGHGLRFRWDLETTNVRLTLYDKSVGVMDQTIGVRGARRAFLGSSRCLLVLNVGNGWEWGNGMIITSDYGSFPHSLRLAPVRMAFDY